MRVASAISIHDEAGARQLAQEPIDAGADITVRVTYFFHCAIPFARRLMCDPLTSLLPEEEREAETDLLAQSESTETIEDMAPPGASFLALSAEASLPLQSAGYTESSK